MVAVAVAVAVEVVLEVEEGRNPSTAFFETAKAASSTNRTPQPLQVVLVRFRILLVRVFLALRSPPESSLLGG